MIRPKINDQTVLGDDTGNRSMIMDYTKKNQKWEPSLYINKHSDKEVNKTEIKKESVVTRSDMEI